MADDTTVPEGYLVWNAGREHVPVGTPCTGWHAGTALQQIHRTEREAIAACHQHRNRIAAETLREAAADWDRGFPSPLGASVIGGRLRARADTLDPPKETP